MQDLPSGIVTFVFTDIEGSTQLWEHYPDRSGAALVRHDRIIEDTVHELAGSVVRPRGEGDSRFVVFSRATDAVTAAVAIQKAFRAEAWPIPVPLKVRVALHTGEAELREGDYYGSAVNRCARLRATAHGGQILVSSATQQLVQDGLPGSEGITLRDLGEHRLKDLQRAERIFQVVAPGLPGDFPPLKSLDNLPNNLPVQLTSFVGRKSEMEEVERLLVHDSAPVQGPGPGPGQGTVPAPAGSARHRQEQSVTRLLTLTGPGGTGKTRLMLQAAAQLLDSYPDGVWLVELAPVVDARLVPQTMALALGLREVAGSTPTEMLNDHLRHMTTLLLLDNCEHVIEECARLVDVLLHMCPHLSLLASSREPLGIGGEFPYKVPSLSLPDSRDRHEMHHPRDLDTLRQYEAVRLFVERAQVAEPRFALTERNAAAVAEVCQRLDGIPLAIELAAARVRVLSVEQIAARLNDRFRLLTGGSRTAMPRQQTLQAAMDWSYDLLSNEERVLLQRLSVFMGGWSLEAAEAICAGDTGDVIGTFDVLDLLSRLVDKSLVVVDQLELRPNSTEPGSLLEPPGTEAIRYRLLETIRQYAAARLVEAGATERVRDRHLDVFLKFAEEMEPKLVGPSAKDSLDIVEAELDNLRAALEWSLSGNEGRGAEKALRLVGALNNIWYWRGYLNEGRRWLERAITLDDSATEAHRTSAMPDADSEQAKHATEDRSRLLARGKVLVGAGMLAWAQADNELAQIKLEECVLLLRQVGDRPNLAQALHILGHAAFDQGDNVGARSFFEESLSLFRELGHKVLGASLVGDLGTVAYYVGDYPTAHHLIEQSIAEFREMPAAQSLPLPRILVASGDLARSEGDYEGALELYETAGMIAREAGTLPTALALHRLGQVAHHTGGQARANSLLKESLTIHRDAGNRPGIAECIAALAGVSASEGHFDRAARLFGAGTALLERIRVPLSPADREQYDADVASTRSQTDGHVPDVAWEEGRAMSFEQATAYALA